MINYKDINKIQVSLGYNISDKLKSTLEYKIKLIKYSTINIDFKTLFEKYDISDNNFNSILDTLYDDIKKYLKSTDDYIILNIETSSKSYKKCMKFHLLEAMKKYGDNISPLYELYILTVGD